MLSCQLNASLLFQGRGDLTSSPRSKHEKMDEVQGIGLLIRSHCHIVSWGVGVGGVPSDHVNLQHVVSFTQSDVRVPNLDLTELHVSVHLLSSAYEQMAVTANNVFVPLLILSDFFSLEPFGSY